MGEVHANGQYVPTGHCVAAADPWGQYVPAGHVVGEDAKIGQNVLKILKTKQ